MKGHGPPPEDFVVRLRVEFKVQADDIEHAIEIGHDAIEMAYQHPLVYAYEVTESGGERA